MMVSLFLTQSLQFRRINPKSLAIACSLVHSPFISWFRIPEFLVKVWFIMAHGPKFHDYPESLAIAASIAAYDASSVSLAAYHSNLITLIILLKMMMAWLPGLPTECGMGWDHQESHASPYNMFVCLLVCLVCFLVSMSSCLFCHVFALTWERQSDCQ